jgi:tRNA(Ile)-lysidine synthase
MVLMHAAATAATGRVRVVHVDHSLHPDSAAWAARVASSAEGLGLPCAVLKVAVSTDSGVGPEASAREARYRALLGEMAEGTCLLTAHHRDDQAETFILQLLRGAGPRGLASMPRIAAFGPGSHIRPFLGLTATQLASYANEQGLSWIDDPSNTDQDLRRNYLRHTVMPLLRERWPGADAAIVRSAKLCAESARRDTALGRIDLGDQGPTGGRSLPLATLRGLSADRMRNALRLWLFQRGARPPGRNRLTSFLHAALTAAPDRNPKVSWGGFEMARYRDALHLYRAMPAPDPAASWDWDGQSELDLGESLGRVRMEPGDGGLDTKTLKGPLSLRLRQGGERIQPAGHAHHRALKDLLREVGCPPWLRDRLPLLYAGDDLVAAGPWWVAAEHAATGRGIHMKWNLSDYLQATEIEE